MFMNTTRFVAHKGVFMVRNSVMKRTFASVNTYKINHSSTLTNNLLKRTFVSKNINECKNPSFVNACEEYHRSKEICKCQKSEEFKNDMIKIGTYSTFIGGIVFTSCYGMSCVMTSLIDFLASIRL